MTISLAIPTYNSSKYFWDCIKSAIDDDFISEIIVHDDFSNDSEYGNLFEITSKINTNKIKIFKGSKNEKAFINKYFTVSKCTNEWVYLFDSDNWFDRSIIDILKKIDYSKKNTCFIGKTLYVTDGNVVTYDYENSIIDLTVAKEYIKNKKHQFDWFLNSGNFIVNKEIYLKSQKDFFSNNIYHGSIDVFLFSYYWFKNNNKYEIIDGLYHHHRVRDGNYFMENFDENMQLIHKYFDMILEL